MRRASEVGQGIPRHLRAWLWNHDGRMAGFDVRRTGRHRRTPVIDRSWWVVLGVCAAAVLIAAVVH